MITKGLFTQIAMLVLSVGIIITYVKPEFESLELIQDDIMLFQSESQKVIAVNNTLAAFNVTKDTISASDLKKLSVYLPSEIDNVNVLRDLYLITKEAGVTYMDSTYEAEADIGLQRQINSTQGADSEDINSVPQAHLVSLSVEGTYSQLKQLVHLLTINNYPLEIRKMSIEQKGGGFLQSEISLITYTHRKSTSGNRIIF